MTSLSEAEGRYRTIVHTQRDKLHLQLEHRNGDCVPLTTSPVDSSAACDDGDDVIIVAIPVLMTSSCDNWNAESCGHSTTLEVKPELDLSSSGDVDFIIVRSVLVTSSDVLEMLYSSLIGADKPFK